MHATVPKEKRPGIHTPHTRTEFGSPCLPVSRCSEVLMLVDEHVLRLGLVYIPRVRPRDMDLQMAYAPRPIG
jgi:hypothetical protein